MLEQRGTRGRSWWSIALVFVGAFIAVAGLIYLAIRFTKEQKRSTRRSSRVYSKTPIPSPLSWDYTNYVSTLPRSGVITDDVLPTVLEVYVKGNVISPVTINYPPVSTRERESAKQTRLVEAGVNSFELKWGVITVQTLKGPVTFKDIQGQYRGSENTFILSSWDWTKPMPQSGVRDRHADGLDPVDWKPFTNDCRLFVISRGVDNALLVRYEQLHAIRSAFNDSIVLVLNSTLAVDIINRLLDSKYEGLCFLVHSTC